MKIKAVIHEAQEGGYWARVPSLRGVYTQAVTLEELEANLREAIELYLSDDSAIAPTKTCVAPLASIQGGMPNKRAWVVDPEEWSNMQLVRLTVQTATTVEFHEITAQIEEQIATSGMGEGLCYVFSPHTSAGLTINENADPDVRHDMAHALGRVVAQHDPAYRHAEGNSAAHLKASMMGFSLVVPVMGGRLVLGTWQGIYLCEFDGPRRRQVLVTVLPAPSAEASG